MPERVRIHQGDGKPLPPLQPGFVRRAIISTLSETESPLHLGGGFRDSGEMRIIEMTPLKKGFLPYPGQG